ncbi:hypothetical protein [Acinetobacter higginsii]|uniref:hypothetical protein n=1 Tax=Acinetobacter higginsii TaxID=70347 RepID=UPI001F4A0E05|nr:hypothetical protein [Acinetobacter higginsii]MCH7381392.1 hypothetical protein [Acinetobacter higginsii]
MDDILTLAARILKIQMQPSSLANELQENGWYPIRQISWIEKDKNESIDSYMERVLTGERYNVIKEDYCYNLYPDRKHILEVAFDLFDNHNYIACIPLFLTQIDGIARDYGVKGMFQGIPEKEIDAKHIKKNYKFVPYVIKQIETYNPKSQQVLKFLYASNFLERGACKAMLINENTDFTTPDNNNYLNRHGILHGFKEYLNYGSRPNALRVINLLVYVINLIESLKKEEKIQTTPNDS